MARLTRTAEGRLVIHFVVMVKNVVHFKNPHIGFFYAGVVRYIKGVG